MKKIPAIAYLPRSRNSEHYHLQEALLKAVPADFATQYNLTTLRETYLSMFNKEDSIFLQTRAFADTEDLTEKDFQRDRLFRLVKLTTQSKELSLNADEAAAAKKILYGMKPYMDAASRPDAENTAMVSDMVKKLQSEEYKTYVEKLGLTGAVAALKTANDEFDAAYSHRADEKRVRAVNDNLLSIRPTVDEAAAKLFDAINALYLVNELVDKDQAKETAIGAVIDAVNAEIVQFSETLSRRGVGKKAKVEPDDKPVTPPEEGGGGSGGGSDRPEIE